MPLDDARLFPFSIVWAIDELRHADNELNATSSGEMTFVFSGTEFENATVVNCAYTVIGQSAKDSKPVPGAGVVCGSGARYGI